MTSLARPAVLGLVLGFVAAGFACGSSKPCGPDTCQGCCDSSGACVAGTGSGACGSAGSTCIACDGGRTCVAGFCSGSNGGGAGGGTADGGGAGGGSGGGTTQSPVDTFLSQLSDAYCARSIACGFSATGSTADCRAFLELLFGDVRRSAALGSTAVEAMAATSCLSGVGATSCDALSHEMSLCLDALRATSVTGHACASGSDCASAGDRCAGGEWCSRACRPLGRLGGPCRSTVCDHGLYCELASNTCQPTVGAGTACPSSTMCDGNSTCTNGSCVALPVAGQTCRSATPRCAETAFCVGTTCQARRPAASACATADECEVGLACVNRSCVVRVGEGATCATSAECIDGLTCDVVLQRCQVVDSSVHQGGTCTRSTRFCQVDSQRCAGQSRDVDGGYTSSGTCRDSQAGDPCVSHVDCNASLYCQPGAPGTGVGVCAAAGDQTPCSTSDNCRAQDDCVSGTCAPRIATDARCSTTGADCADPAAVCVGASDSTSATTCRRLAAPGATCRSGTSSCQFPAVCEDGGCVVAGHPGEPCLGLFGCLDGVCLAADGGPGTAPTGRCYAARGDGASCTAASNCTGTCDLNAGECVAACR